MTVKIAALLTCFNRKEKTLECLRLLFAQAGVSDATLEVYLVDDGSTDGTAAAVAQTYPQVNILTGTGNLFWNGGMRLAWDAAMPSHPDYYLWLNDDTLLYPDALHTLLETSHQLSQKGEDAAIVAGSVQDPETQVLTYGGLRQKGPLYPPFKAQKIPPTDAPQVCDMMCGNFVLIPQTVVAKIGNLDPQLTHYAGDWDYGLRARQAGCSVWIAPGFQGTCPRNPKPNPSNTPDLQKG
ncbi:MAG: glycosyltransferase family 2 protein, partial [Jaaginema sp. PMC 1079.18]|nr:glycosyltransferase family 2 protein [Jaaginema sp. PMC 1079.18]